MNCYSLIWKRRRLGHCKSKPSPGTGFPLSPHLPLVSSMPAGMGQSLFHPSSLSPCILRARWNVCVQVTRSNQGHACPTGMAETVLWAKPQLWLPGFSINLPQLAAWLWPCWDSSSGRCALSHHHSAFSLPPFFLLFFSSHILYNPLPPLATFSLLSLSVGLFLFCLLFSFILFP